MAISFKRFSLVCAVIVIASGVAFAGGNWSNADSKTSSFFNETDKLRRLTPNEAKNLVTAICAAEEDARRTVSSEASSRAKDNVQREFDKLGGLKREAETELDNVLADPTLSSYHSRAGDYKSDIGRRWENVERMTRNLRGSNHPVVNYMLVEGQNAHRSYQTSSSNCHQSEWVLKTGARVDCLVGDSSSCKVIELKPRNSAACARGLTQAQGYAAELNKRTESFIELIKKDSRFEKCQIFEPVVYGYTLCPEIDDNGEMRATYVSWSTSCS